MRRSQRILIVAEDATAKKIQAELGRLPVTWLQSNNYANIVEDIADMDTDLILIDLNSTAVRARFDYLWEQLQAIKLSQNIQIITLLSRDDIGTVQSDGFPDDFVLSPYESLELETRMRRLLADGNHQDINRRDTIQSRDLVIDLAACEVTLGGAPLMLTHKEYELLRFLAANKERVFTRDALLEQVWGYDYYGGDRTVDVHIRRLRSKLNDTDGTYIKTVRNIGYKFNEP